MAISEVMKAIGPAVLPSIALALGCAGAAASPRLASDKGCYNCHGDPPQKKAPTFAALAARYAPYKGNTGKQHELADKLREGSIFGHVNAHERLGHDEAEALIRWLCEGASSVR